MKGTVPFMILIIDEERSGMGFALKSELEGYRIPAIVTTYDKIKNYPAFLLAVVFADSETYLNLVSVRLGRCYLIAVNGSGSRIYNKDVIFCDDGKSVAEFVVNFMKSELCIDPENLTAGELSIKNDCVQSGLAYLKLTATEKRILILFVIMRGKWVSENTVHRACFDDSTKKKSDKVSVHICNLNKKGRACTGRPLILCKRGVGYTLNLNL